MTWTHWKQNSSQLNIDSLSFTTVPCFSLILPLHSHHLPQNILYFPSPLLTTNKGIFKNTFITVVCACMCACVTHVYVLVSSGWFSPCTMWSTEIKLGHQPPWKLLCLIYLTSPRKHLKTKHTVQRPSYYRKCKLKLHQDDFFIFKNGRTPNVG